MKHAKRNIPAYLLIGIAAITALVLLLATVFAHISRRRAEQLLHDVRQLQVGKSTLEEARAVIVRHGGGVSRYDNRGCSREHCTFDIALKHYPLLVEVWGPYVLNPETNTWKIVCVFPFLGLEDWSGGATVTVDGGIVTHADYGVFVRGRGGWVLGRDVEEFVVIPESRRDTMGQRSYYVHGLNITTLGGGKGITTTLTSKASAEERNRAYDFDFDCLTKLGGCTSLSQFAPSGFANLEKESY